MSGQMHFASHSIPSFQIISAHLTQQQNEDKKVFWSWLWHNDCEKEEFFSEIWWRMRKGMKAGGSSPFQKDCLTCDVIAQAFIFKQALPEQAEVSGRIDWNITEFVLIAKGSVQNGIKVRTCQIFSCWFCKQGDGKRGPWKNNSWLQKEGFCPRLGWIMQNQTLQLLRLLWVQKICEFCLH